MLHKFSNYLFVFIYYFPYYSNYLLFINNELICVILKQIIGFQDVYIYVNDCFLLMRIDLV